MSGAGTRHGGGGAGRDGPVGGGRPAEHLDGLRILPVPGIGTVRPGADLAELIVAAAPWLRDGDVLVVTSKIVSKAEGRLVELPAGEPERTAAREQILAAESARVVARRGPTTIVQTHHGFVMAAAGIDASNVEHGRLVLLPKDPDASARALRADLWQRHRLDVAVVVSDTMGRPWRNGLTDVALGAAGIEPVRDHRGQVDPYGNDLQLTQMAVVDELAAAGDLVKGKLDQVPVAVVRGYRPPPPGTDPGARADDGPGAVALVRDGATDMFSLGTAEARAAGRRDVAVLAETERLPGGPVDPLAVARAVAAVAAAVAPGTTFSPQSAPSAGEPAPPVVVRCDPPAADPSALVRFGADVHRLRAALAAEGLASAVHSAGPTTAGVVVAVSGAAMAGTPGAGPDAPGMPGAGAEAPGMPGADAVPVGTQPPFNIA